MDVDCPQLRNGKGYDHNFILDGGDGEKVAAELYSPDTGIAMTVRTTMPGSTVLQRECVGMARSGNPGCPMRRTWACAWRRSISPMRCRARIFPSPVLHKGALYAHDTSFTFSCK